MIDIEISGVSRGQKVAFMAYNGDSLVEAKALYNYLDVYRQHGKLLPLNNSKFCLHISDVDLVEFEDSKTFIGTENYQVRLKGLIETEKVSFCMRCFSNSAVPLNNGNFCHNCGSEGTCVEMYEDDAKYLRKNIEHIIGCSRKECKK